tara:strand:+ start:47 stop:364 length:318 start_codon:yes stop_codon:yes gene_type:complete
MNEENMVMRNLYEEFANEDIEYDEYYEEELLHDELMDESGELDEELLEMLRNMTQSEYNDWIENQVPYYFGEAPMPQFLRVELLNRCRNYNMGKREKEGKILRRQ